MAIKVKVAEGSCPLDDDSQIYVSKGSKICETRFSDRKGRAFEVRCAGTLANSEPKGTDWIEMSITEFGEKRSKYLGFCLHDLEQVRRLRDICNLVLGEAEPSK